MKKLVICTIMFLLIGCTVSNKKDQLNNFISNYCEDRNLELEEVIIKETIKNIGYYSIAIVGDSNHNQKLIFANQNIANGPSKYGFNELGPFELKNKEQLAENLGKDYGRDKNYYFGVTVGNYSSIIYDGKNLKTKNKTFILNGEKVTLTSWTLISEASELIDKEKMRYK